MNAVGRIRDVTRNVLDGTYTITFTIQHLPSDIDSLTGCDALDITATRHRERRSLSANSYFHVLSDKIAKELRISATEAKNALIRDYGQLDYLPDGALNWSIKPESFDYLKSTTEHLRPSGRVVEDKGKKLPIYFVMRGSHTYNTEEMSILIDGAVSEAKELGIETLTPAELARMKANWKP